MSTQLLGHQEIVARFQLSLTRGRLPSTLLFVGPAGVGKRTFAIFLAQALLCERRPAEELDPCGSCPACLQVPAGSHPDLEIVSKPADKNFIPLELFIGDQEHRMREGLCHRIALKPARGQRKVAIIDDADYLNQEGANCLLKTLEEPPPGSVLILIGTSEQKQLPTIRSRCQIIRFQPLPPDIIAQLIQQHGLVEEAHEAELLAQLADGSLARAQELAVPELREARQMLLDVLASSDWDAAELARSVGSIVDAAGKDASPRRQRMRQLMSMAADFYRHLMWMTSGSAPPADQELASALDRAAERWPHGSEAAALCAGRCLDAIEHVDRNANQAALLECWLDELATIARTGHAPLGAPLLLE